MKILMRKWTSIVAAALLLAACGGGSESDVDVPGMANPASVYCIEQGGTLDIREGDGGQYGVCIFDDGSECGEWDYFHGDCAPGGG